jgi:tRNA nucleotidyltransferase (CCA-adding enzyme)
MAIPAPTTLAEQVRSLPATEPVLARLGDEAHRVYVVGGAVRDLLLGGRPLDLDLVTEGDTAELCARLEEGAVIHDRFGTCTVSVEGHTYDLARARRERYPHPGALPDVEPAGLEEDLLRRDFTVNAMALALAGPGAGRLHAGPNAVEDLEARRLRVLHDRSFIDDPTRLMRLIRYHARLGFEIAPDTRRLAADAVSSGALDTVSGNRIGAELRLLAREPDPVRALAALGELGLDAAVHPRFGLRDTELAERALALLPEDGRGDRLVLALAAWQVRPGQLAALLDRLAFEAGDRDAILAAVTRAREAANALEAARRPSEIADAVAGAGPELVALAGALGPSDAASKWLERLRAVKLGIDGSDLLRAGVAEGPAIGEGLRAALRAKLDGEISGREAELETALSAIKDSG